MFAGKKSAQIREILISESAWEEMTCLFAPSLAVLYHSERNSDETKNNERSTSVNFAFLGLRQRCHHNLYQRSSCPCRTL
ncbi:hypothetical protein ET132_04635 [Klebsiella pneumoniae]|nr:hypothetical protein ET132_04635 [Klebsiella pneumoniae]